MGFIALIIIIKLLLPFVLVALLYKCECDWWTKETMEQCISGNGHCETQWRNTSTLQLTITLAKINQLGDFVGDRTNGFDNDN